MLQICYGRTRFVAYPPPVFLHRCSPPILHNLSMASCCTTSTHDIFTHTMLMMLLISASQSPRKAGKKKLSGSACASSYGYITSSFRKVPWWKSCSGCAVVSNVLCGSTSMLCVARSVSLLCVRVDSPGKNISVGIVRSCLVVCVLEN